MSSFFHQLCGAKETRKSFLDREEVFVTAHLQLSQGNTIGGALNVKKRPNEKTTLAFSLYP